MMIAGSGSLLSILTAGGVVEVSEAAADCFLKMLGRKGCWAGGENWCCRRA